MTNTQNFGVPVKTGIKPWLKMLGWFLLLVIVLGALKGYSVWKMIEGFKNAPKPVVSVSTLTLQTSDWQPEFKAVGSLRAVRGVDLAIEAAGVVQKVDFDSGQEVLENQLLLELDSSVEHARLESLTATLQLAEVNFQRSKSQAKVKNVSQSQLDADAAALRSARAQVEEQQALLARKIVRAPFAGKIGISNISIGKYLKAGDQVVSLQQLDPIYVDFYLPQQALAQLALQQDVSIRVDSVPDKIFAGKLTAIDALVEAETRNVRVQATVANPDHRLLPGMFVDAAIAAGSMQKYLTVPQTAVVYNSFGDIVYVVEKVPAKDGEPAKQLARQVFVTLGPARGDQVAILKGLEEGAEVITSGQLKLKNGADVTINNSVQPSNNPKPEPVDQ